MFVVKHLPVAELKPQISHFIAALCFKRQTEK